MNANWQDYLALTTVLVTAGLFVWRFFRPKGPGCQAGCGCSPTTKTKAKLRPKH